MTLHILNQSPFDNTSVADCMAVLQKADTLVLIENGAYAALEGNGASDILSRCQNCYVIADDVSARGLGGKINDQFELIDYPKFVDLCAEHTPIQSWF